VEYAGNGNFSNDYGDVSTGKVEGSNLGYGITAGKGAIWICMPYVDSAKGENAITWWGDVEATVDYCQKTVSQVCEAYGGDATKVFIAGFSRGAIACNYIGLHDDEIAALWCGFIAYDHYDGIYQWGYANDDRASALVRLQRLGDRPQFICNGVLAESAESYLHEVYPIGNFTFRTVPFRNHNDAWILRPTPARDALHKWFNSLCR
jgi:hypothetical protein